MTRIVAELYDALKAAGASEEQSRAAAGAVMSTDDWSDFATKGDIAELRALTKADLAELESRIIKWNVGTILAAAGLATAIARLL